MILAILATVAFVCRLACYTLMAFGLLDDDKPWSNVKCALYLICETLSFAAIGALFSILTIGR